MRCYTVDLGQPDEESLDAVRDRMVACGAEEAVVVPGLRPLAEAGLKVVQAQARYEGGYWNTTGIARPVTIAAILPKLRRAGVDVLFHGATGRGNDQVRFQLAANVLEPGVEIYAPWRDAEFVAEFPGRREMIDYCRSNDLPIRPGGEARYSTDANLLGLTHEAGDLEDVRIPAGFVEPGMGVWPWDAPDRYEIATVRWEEGVPVELNGEKLDLVATFETANRLAGKHGVGIGQHVVENRFVGDQVEGYLRGAGHRAAGTDLRVPAPVHPRPPGSGALRPHIEDCERTDIPGVLAGPHHGVGNGRSRTDHPAGHRRHNGAFAQGRGVLRVGRRHP